jgi:Fe-S cluster biogenesis protein NfuA
MFIQVEETPNPLTLKFLPGQNVTGDAAPVEFKTGDALHASPLAQSLFGITGVAGVFLGRDFVTITRDANADWSYLKPMMIGAMMDHFVSGFPVLAVTAAAPTPRALPDDELSKQIIAIIDERVRPAVAADGGDIMFDRFEDGIVYVQMQGACNGCPSSAATLKNGIERMLQHFVPEVVEVKSI